MFQVGQKVVRIHPVNPVSTSKMVVGQVYTISWVSPSKTSCHVEEIPDAPWQTHKFAAAEGYELPAEPKTNAERIIFYNRRSLPSAPAKV